MPFRLESHVEPIPGYRLVERLGSGGFGEVWKAEAPGGLLKAIKFVYGDLETCDSDGVRAEQELKSLSRVKMIRHPYILSLERFDIKDGQLMIVMELADRNLWDRFRECRTQNLSGIPRDELLRYMDEAAEALDMMNNEHQLQHLDIKPQNLFLVYNHVKVADFGLVKDLAGRAASVTGGVTPLYAAPEMFDGWVSRFCDQYSLAIVYQELLTGQRPFQGTNVHQLVMQHMQGKPDLSVLPPADRDIIARALAKKPEERHASCLDLVQALRGASPGGPAHDAGSTRVLPRSGRFQRPGLDDLGPPILAADDAPAEPADLSLAVTVRPSKNGAAQGSPEEHAPAAPPEAAPEPAPEQPPVVTEVTGDGELRPALVVGLGQRGVEVLQQLHQALEESFGSRDAVPQLRLLGLDTDPDVLQAANQDHRGSALSSRDVVVARLNRVSHYLKPREGRPPLESWFNTNMLYRIQRTQVTGGLRALGRLAFFDHYRTIVGRLRTELLACTQPDAMAGACRRTGRRLWTNVPRVYVVTSLAGGSGGGIFLDVAYVLHNLLRETGYARAEVIGVLLLPPVTRNPARSAALANTFAALTELHHFAAPDVAFRSRYDTGEKPLDDPEPPFHRCFLVPMAADPDESANAHIVTRLVGRFLYHDLTTQFARACEAARAALGPSPLASFGMVRFTWARAAVLRRVARRLCARLVERWAVRDVKAVGPRVQQLLQQDWAQKDLAADTLIERLRGACERALGQVPENVFATLTTPFVPKSRWRSPHIAPDAVVDAVNKIDEIVGQPTHSAILHRPGVLEEVLEAEGEAMTAEWTERLNKTLIPLLDHPDFRLAGAEEAIRQTMALVEQISRHHEELCRELTGKAAAANERLQLLRPKLRELVTAGRRSAITDLVELLCNYPKWRFQSLVLKRLGTVYTALRTHLSDRLREVAYYRTRLEGLLADLGSPGLSSGEREFFRPRARSREPVRAEVNPSSASMSASTLVRLLYPAGCQHLAEAVDRCVTQITPAEVDELDRHVQNLIRSQFDSLAHVCSTSSVLVKNLGEAMLHEAESFARRRLSDDDPVAMYLGQFTSDDDVRGDLAGAFDEAAPRITGPEGTAPEISVVSVPESPYQERLLGLARQVLGGVVPAVSADDILVYREQACPSLSRLEHLGPHGREAYEQMFNGEHLTPHSRIDITDWKQCDEEDQASGIRSQESGVRDQESIVGR
jgi:hypothetical protein